jgi:ribosome-binding factor A
MVREFKRTDRVGDMIQRELSMLIQREVNDPRIGMVTLSEVSVSKDFAQAKVYVNVLEQNKSEQTVEALNKASGFLRKALAKRVKLRMTPSLRFYYDDTLIRANKIEKLINSALANDTNYADEITQ